MRRAGWLLAMLATFLVGCADEDDGDSRPAGGSTSEPRESAAEAALTSAAFDDGGEIPVGFTCDGAQASPPLEWSGLPPRSVEVAFLVEDPDAPTPEPFVHWVVWGVDPAAGRLPEETLPAGTRQGENGAGASGWLGPCPPPGDEPHRYVFTLFALSEPLDLADGASADELRSAIEGQVIAEAELVGTYQRREGQSA